MVELQLIHCPEIKSSIDRAWGVAQSKSKKKDTVAATTEATREDLQFVAIGQDVERTRYWVADGESLDKLHICTYLHVDPVSATWAPHFTTP